MKVLCVTSIKNNSKTSFKSKVVSDYPYNSASAEIKDLVDKFEEGQVSSTELGHGLFASAHRIQDKQVVIKKSFDSQIARSVNDKFSKEASALKLVPDNIQNSQRLLSRVETQKGNYYLLSNLVNGSKANPKDNPWTQKHYNSLMNTLFLLDKAHVYHMDLNTGNCLLTKEGKVNIIDYQWAQEFSPFRNNKNIDMPDFVIPSNIQMFEKATLAKYLCELADEKGPESARQNFKAYLREKANFEERHCVFLKNEERRYCNTDNDANSAIKYEELQSRIFKNPSDEILDLELSKLDVQHAFREAYYLHDKNIDKPRNILQAVPTYLYTGLAIKSYYNKINEIESKDSDKDIQEYLKYEHKNAEYLQNYFSWIPENFKWLLHVATGKESDPNNQIASPNLNEFKNISTLQTLIKNKSKEKYEIQDVADISQQQNKLKELLTENKKYTSVKEKDISLDSDHMKQIAALKNPLYSAIEQSSKELEQGKYLSCIACCLYGITAARQLNQSAEKGLSNFNYSQEEDYIKKQLDFSKTTQDSLIDITKSIFKKVYASSKLNATGNDDANIYNLSKLQPVYNGKNDELFKIKIKGSIKNANLPEKRSLLKILFNPSVVASDEFANLGKTIGYFCNSKNEANLARNVIIDNLSATQSSYVLQYLETFNKFFKNND